MNTHHNIHLLKTKTDLKVTYRDGRFLQIKKLRGKLDAEMIKYIGFVIPPEEKDLDAFIIKNKDKVVYTSETVKEKSIFSKFQEVWYQFYLKEYKLKPKFDGSEGKALNSIIKYLKNINAENEEQALTDWKTILDNWEHLPEFYQKKSDLKKINSNFNVIRNELKDSIRKKTGASHSESRKTANNIADKFF